MRFIKKIAVPAFHTSWLAHRPTGNTPLYRHYSYKRQLNEELRSEQHYICCYCQRSIKHFYDPTKGGIGAIKYEGSRNEHLYPESGHPNSVALQVDYNNLYACCVDSMGHKEYEKHLRYCDVAKDNNLVPELINLINDVNCSTYFRYTLEGEIIPNGQYNSWNEYLKNAKVLSQDLKDALTCIYVLNLNCVTLVADRIQCITALTTILGGKSKSELTQIKKNMISSPSYPSYIDLCIQLIDNRINQMP